jgi:hypothetical protein
MGPAGVTPRQYSLLCNELGIPSAPASQPLVDISDGDVMDRLSDGLTKKHQSASAEPPLSETASTSPGDNEATSADAEVDDPLNPQSAAIDILDSISTSPWTAADFPTLAEWVAENEVPLNLLVAAAEKPRFFSPPPNFLENPQSPVVEMLLPHVPGLRTAGRSLAARAAFRAGTKDYSAAWQDCLACWRLGAHAASGPTLVERLVGMAIRRVAMDSTMMILQCDDLPDDVAQQILDDLNALAPSIAVADVIDQCERFMYLDYVLRRFTGRLGGFSRTAGEFEKAFSQVAGILSFDIDVPLRTGNKWYTRMAKAAAITDRSTRRQQLDRIQTDLDSLQSQLSAGTKLKLLLRNERSEWTAGVLASLFLPATDAAVDASDRDAIGMTLTRLAAALALYRAQRREYPESLEALTPGIVASIPLDPYSAAPLHYERRGDGYLLYSVFQNGVDDGGRDFSGEIVGGEWVTHDEPVVSDFESSDFVVRVPRPPRKDLGERAPP